MKVINHTCKFCGKPIALKIDDSSDGLGDPFKLLDLAACNTCADLRVERRVLTNCLLKVATELLKIPKASRAVTSVKVRPDIDRLTAKYVDMVNRWTNNKFDWEPEITTAILANPENIGETLSRLWPNRPMTRKEFVNSGQEL